MSSENLQYGLYYTCSSHSNRQQVIVYKAESYNKCDINVEEEKEYSNCTFLSENIRDQLSGYEHSN